MTGELLIAVWLAGWIGWGAWATYMSGREDSEAAEHNVLVAAGVGWAWPALLVGRAVIWIGKWPFIALHHLGQRHAAKAARDD